MRLVLASAAATASLILVGDSPPAEACGCLSPPAVSEGDYAVNQSAEQIIFEVQPGWVTAHVLIRYAGDPAQFAWIIPVPEVPTELAISPSSAFGLIDKATAPQITVQTDDLCPISEYSCRFREHSTCGGISAGAPELADASASTDAAGSPGGVTVIDEKTVGDYQTVTFRASEAGAATQWLRDNGFLVNPTTSIYMESYVQANMVFVAAKLVPGAGAQAIKPLKLTYRSAFPMIPLVLTAVAAQPNLTVTSFVYSDTPFRPLGHPIVEISRDRLATNAFGRLNYPMVLARTIDEAGGDGFIVEYRGGPAQPLFNNGVGGCCGNDFDTCFIANDGQCQCPGDAFDQADCAQIGDLVDGVALVKDLATRYSALTRLTTRVSPEEMTFDPTFEPDRSAQQFGTLRVNGNQASLDACPSQVIDQDTLNTTTALRACSAMYCGPGGSCVATAQGGACACDSAHVAQQYTDLDGQVSVTCVPTTPPCDLRAGGDVLPDACAGKSCGNGRCIDRNGIAVCACDPGNAATNALGGMPTCRPVVLDSRSPGADDYSEPLRALDVCAPPPPDCGDDGWLEKTGSPRPGVDCGNSHAAAWLMWPKPDVECGVFGCAGCTTDDASPLAPIAGGSLVLGLLVLRRRGRR